MAGLKGLQQRFPEIIRDVRGRGLLIGVEIADPSGSDSGGLARAIQRAALERGLIVELGGRHGAVVRFLPPLNVTRRTLDQAVEILRESIRVVAARA